MNGKMIVAAMSGGVDSSVVAALLAREGHHVVGITLQLYDAGRSHVGGRTCCAGVDIRDARRVADHIGIPHYILNYQERFRATVIDDFVRRYQNGQTPIPCVQCNQKIKFHDLLLTARELGAESLATGHYVRRQTKQDSHLELRRGRDLERDQSYFLFNTSQEQLRFLRFPLGDMPKDKVRELAHQWKLPVADKPDSQDICFVPDGNYARLVERLGGGSIPGKIIHVDGEVLGQHQGIDRFTVGQRRGIGIGGRKDQPEEALYVVRIDPETHHVIVGPHEALARTVIILDHSSWVAGKAPSLPLRTMIQFRSSQKPVSACVEQYGSQLHVVTDQAQYGVSPGQACVFYDDEQLLGGGWIIRTEDAPHPLPDRSSKSDFKTVSENSR